MKDIHGGNIWAVAQKYGLKVDEMIDFSASINPLILDEDIRSIILKNIDSIFHYPDPGYRGLINEIARWLNINHENILVGNGSVEFIYLMPRVLKPKKVLIPVPTFSEYEKAVKQSGATPQFIYGKEENGFKPSIQDYINSLDDIEMIFLCNPNNPTGQVLNRKELLELIDACDERGIWVVIDEAFIEFLDDHEDVTLVYKAVGKRRLMVLRSLTKSFSIPGLRLGYLIGNEEIAKILKEVQEPWRINSLAQAVGREVIQDFEYLKRARELIKGERDLLFSELRKMEGIRLFPSRVNFILIALCNERMDAETLSEKLAMRGILVRDLSNMRGLDRRFFRIAAKRHWENERLIAALREIL